MKCANYIQVVTGFVGIVKENIIFSFFRAKVYIYKIDQLLALFIIFFNLYHI